MDIWTLLNIEMDKLAGEHYQQHKEEVHPNIAMANETLTVWIDDEKLSCFHKQMLYNKVFARIGRTETDKSTWTCKEFWKERENIPDASMEHIYWKAPGKSLVNARLGTERWMLKHSTGQCGVGRMLLR